MFVEQLNRYSKLFEEVPSSSQINFFSNAKILHYRSSKGQVGYFFIKNVSNKKLTQDYWPTDTLQSGQHWSQRLSLNCPLQSKG